MQLKVLAGLALCVGLSLSGCSVVKNLIALNDDLNEIEDTIEVISGVVVDETLPTNNEAQIIAVLISPDIEREDQSNILAYKILSALDPHFVFTRVRSDSTLAAFKDINGNYVLDKGEPSVFLDQDLKLSDHTFNRDGHDDNTLVLAGETSNPPFIIDVTFDSVKKSIGYMRNIGVVTDFDNPNFSDDSVRLGLWEPLQFANEIGFGVYLLEPWDQEKDVLLLVHGINDSPKTWETAISTLDLKRQQIVLFQYPSAFSLEASATVLANLVEELYQRVGNKRIDILAHSMGGLIAKRFIQIHDTRDIAHNIRQFVSISTPWGGHGGAKIGLDTAPVIIPVWRDMAPGSNFLNNLETEGLPSHINHLLIFTFADQKWSNTANDGTVTLSSQLIDTAQDEATLSYGFDEGHSSVLQSDELVSRINVFLENYRDN